VKQEVAPGALQRPAGQAAQAAAEARPGSALKVPPGHKNELPLPGGQKEPAAQRRHAARELEPAGERVPSGHSKGESRGGQKYPAAHWAHEVPPREGGLAPLLQYTLGA